MTRQCLEILFQHDWPVTIQTRSPLVLRDLDLFQKAKNLDVGLSITTANDEIRRIFEPHAPPVGERLRAVAELHRQRIRTYVMIAPLLPDAEKLVGLLAGKVDYVIVDRMNYHYADGIYARYGWKDKNTDRYFKSAGRKIVAECRQFGIDCRRSIDRYDGTDHRFRGIPAGRASRTCLLSFQGWGRLVFCDIPPPAYD